MNYTNYLSTNSVLFSKLAKIFLGVIALAAVSNISIPMQPVSITLSTIMVMAIGLAYSRIEAVTTVGSYLIAGAMGAPVFMNFGSTISHIVGPSGGYLLGYLIAVYIMTYMRERFNISSLYNCIIGHFLIYVPGVLWLSTFVGIDEAIYKGFIVYIPSGIIKIGFLIALIHIIGVNKVKQ